MRRNFHLTLSGSYQNLNFILADARRGALTFGGVFSGAYYREFTTRNKTFTVDSLVIKQKF